jgi:C4-dicarboxylate transporter DctM subunit
MGVVVVPYMIKYGYERNFSVGVVAAAGTMGIVIPPSIPLILYGILAEQSIPRLFLAGIPAGILEGVLYASYIFITSKKRGFKGREKVNKDEVITSTIKALPGLALPVLVLVGIYAGIVTVTEAAALAVFLSLVVSIYIYKEVKTNEIAAIATEGMKSAGMIMIIISTALLFGTYLTQSGNTQKLVEFVQNNNLSAWQFLLIINIVLLFLGMFLEVVSVMYIVLPIVLPLLAPLGIDPIHFAIVILVNMEVALITPPVGLNLYVLSKATNTPVTSVIKGTFPYVILGLLQLIFITYYAPFSTFLPNLLMPK